MPKYHVYKNGTIPGHTVPPNDMPIWPGAPLLREEQAVSASAVPLLPEGEEFHRSWSLGAEAPYR